MRPRLWLARAAAGLRELMCPRPCAVCGATLTGSEAGVCRTCLDELPATRFEAWGQNPMKEAMDGRVEIVSAFAGFFFHKGETLREIVHQFKYDGNRLCAIEMGRELGRMAVAAGFDAPYDVLVPVPLHKARERRRGYNQSLLLARGMAQTTGLEVRADILTRTRNMQSQTRLSHAERAGNVRGGFGLAPRAADVAGRGLLLVDDVFTTGATSQACLETLGGIPGVRLGLVTVGYAAG